MAFTKEIRIHAKDLKGPPGAKEIYILLGFDRDAINTSKTPYDISVWRVAPFTLHKPGQQAISVTYDAKLGVCKAQVDSGKVAVATIDKPISAGHQIDLVDDKNPRFDNLTTYFDPIGFAVNDKITDEPVAIGVGLYDYNNRFSPIAVWQGVPDGASVDIQFTPIISISATSEFVGGQLLKGHISSVLWKHDIADATLPKTLVFNLVWNTFENNSVLTEVV